MRKVCVFTGTRADYGILKPLLEEFKHDRELCLQIIASGMHLSPEFGYTADEITIDGFEISEKIEILLSSDTPIGLSKSTGIGLISFAEALTRLRPDFLVILGDRFEAFAIAAAAMFCRIPIAHIHGGEATQALIDEPIRHAITKMSHIHFTSTEEYRKRVIQLGEQPDRVFNVGALGVENIKKLPLLSKGSLKKEIEFLLEKNYFLVTFHPVTLDQQTAEKHILQLLNALSQWPNFNMIFTKANADTDGRIINKMIDQYVAQNAQRAIAFTSMGQMRYLSAMGYASLVVGNSSSGILEAPSLGVPTVNIGDRQKGRIRATSVIDCQPIAESICQAITKGLSSEFQSLAKKTVNPYEKKGTAQRITKIIKEFDLAEIIQKEFYDLPLLSSSEATNV